MSVYIDIKLWCSFQPDAGLGIGGLEIETSPPYPLPSSLFVDGQANSPVLRTSPAGLMAEDGGIYSCIILDEQRTVQFTSSITISVLRKFCTNRSDAFSMVWYPIQHILSPWRRGVYSLHQDTCTQWWIFFPRHLKPRYNRSGKNGEKILGANSFWL